MVKVTFLLLCIFVIVSSYKLDVFVYYPESKLVSKNALLYLRGNSLGLSWERGVALQRVERDTFKLSLEFDQSAINSTFVITTFFI